MDESQLIREGFICPVCQEDCTSSDLLQSHFELKHNKSNVDYEKSNGAISNVIAKAKTLILSNIDKTNEHQYTLAPSSSTLSPFRNQLNTNQDNGYFRSHTLEFKDIRDKTVGRHVIQTNKLLITLDKLITNDLLKDEHKRKAYEMSIVPWIPDNLVDLCPTCSRSFNILHRKHHCRLCGAIMCNRCSSFMSITLAKQLTDPSLFMSQFKDSELKMKRSNSDTSISSHINEDASGGGSGKDQYLRLCSNCSLLLNKKYQSLRDKADKPVIFTYYDDFYACIKESEKIYPNFNKMAESLRTGESVHSLKNAEEMRIKLLKMYQRIDLLSNSILTHGVPKQQQSDGTPAEPPQVSPEQLKLQKNIRVHAINYLKEYSFKLTQLPTPEEYEKLKEQKRKYLVEELEREKREQHSSQNRSNGQLSGVCVNSDGWIPPKQTLNQTNVQNRNPIEIQIDLVRKYLDDARKQKRYEEVKILESNLNELYSMVNEAE